MECGRIASRCAFRCTFDTKPSAAGIPVVVRSCGPAVLALDYNYHAPALELPKAEADLGKWLVADESPAVFRINRPDGRPVRLNFRPFYQTPEDFPYLVYFGLDREPYALW